MQQFEASLVRPAGTGTWTFVQIPFDVVGTYGVRGQIKVKGTVNGVPIRASLMPNGDGTHYMVVKQSVRDEAGVTAGDTVLIAIEPDTDERTVDVPEDFQEALGADAEASAFFEKLSYSHRKEYVEWILSAKKEETRAKRIGQAVDMLAKGKKAK